MNRKNGETQEHYEQRKKQQREQARLLRTLCAAVGCEKRLRTGRTEGYCHLHNGRNHRLMTRYGINQHQYDVLLWYNDGCCWICGKHPKPGGLPLHVEHDHRTKRVRGLTCWQCNQALAYARDKPAILRKAADYLESTVAQDLIALERMKDA